MSAPEPPVDDPPKAPLKRDNEPGWADAAAIGIGCLVVIIFFGALVIVGIMRGEG